MNPSLLMPADFAIQINEFKPPGAAWPRDPASVQFRAFAGLSDGIARAHARAVDLLDVESSPDTASELLVNFEAEYGLPDHCTPLNPTVPQRRAALLAKIAAIGGQSRAYYIAVAAAMGFTVTITEFVSARADISLADDPCWEPDADFTWQVNAATIPLFYALADINVGDDPVETPGNTMLECRLRDIAPAHTILNFVYGS